MDGKSNEITAVPKLLELLSLKGAIITTDALNCQRAIAGQIVRQGADYALALKGNQQALHADVSLFFDDKDFNPTSVHTATDADHGRIETRVSAVSTDVAWLQERHQWPGLAAIGKVTRIREAAGKTTTETAYYLLSAPLAAHRFHEVVRHHWGIENSLHWVLDVTMNEDQSRNRKDHSPENLALLRRLALNLAKLEPSKGSMKAKLKQAGWDNASSQNSWHSSLILKCDSPAAARAASLRVERFVVASFAEKVGGTHGRARERGHRGQERRR